MNKFIDKILGHGDGDKGDGDYSNKNLDIDKYEKEHAGKVPYQKGPNGEYLDDTETTQARRDTSGYDANSNLPEHSRHGNQQETSDYTSGTTGRSANTGIDPTPTVASTTATGASTYDQSGSTGMSNIDMTGAAPATGLDTTEGYGNTSRSAEYETTTSATTGYGATTSGTTGFNSAAIYEIPVEHAHEVLPGPANITGQIVSSETTSYEPITTGMSNLRVRDETTYNTTSSGNRETMTERAEDKLDQYSDRNTSSQTQSSGLGYGDSRALDRGSGANATGAARDTAGVGSSEYSSSGNKDNNESMMDKVTGLFTNQKHTDSYSGQEYKDGASSTSQGAGYGHSSALDRASGANATGASRGETSYGTGNTGSSGYDNTSSNYDRASSSVHDKSSSDPYGSSGRGSSGATQELSASDEAAKVRAAYEKNEETYAPSADQGPNVGTTHNTSSGGSSATHPSGSNQRSSGNDQSSSSGYGQDNSSSGYNQGSSTGYSQGSSTGYGQSGSGSGNLSHAIGGDYDNTGSSYQGESKTQRLEDRLSGTGNTGSSGYQGESTTQRLEDRLSGSGNQGSSNTGSKGESLMQRAEDTAEQYTGRGNTNSTGYQGSGQY